MSPLWSRMYCCAANDPMLWPSSTRGRPGTSSPTSAVNRTRSSTRPSQPAGPKSPSPPGSTSAWVEPFSTDRPWPRWSLAYTTHPSPVSAPARRA